MAGTRCVGAQFQVCSGGAYKPRQDCAAPLVCDDRLGCVECRASLGPTTCVGDAAYDCGPDGSLGVLQERCAAGQCREGACVSADCVEGTDLMTLPACTGMKVQYATSRLVLPGSGMAFATDIDGDGVPDNKLRQLFTALGNAGVGLQASLDEAAAAGSLVELLEIQAPDLGAADCVAGRLQEAQPRGPGDPRPRYDGTDSFVLPAGARPAELRGQIAMGELSSTAPPLLPRDNAPRLTLNLPLLGAKLTLTIHGAHLQGRLSKDGVMSGELHGAVRGQDVEGAIIQTLAEILTQAIRSAPMSPSTDNLVRLFEDQSSPVTQKKCMVPADCCEKPNNRGTCRILPDEVRDNALVASLLAPDLQVFQGDRWSPVKKGDAKDALSFGIGFTAVRATF